MSTSDRQAFQFMNYCRKVAILDQESFLREYDTLSGTAKRQINSFPAVNRMPSVVQFPWIIPGYTKHSQANQSLPSPPLPNAVLPPIVTRIPTNSTTTTSTVDVVVSDVEFHLESPIQEIEQVLNNRTTRRRTRSTDSDNSDDSYHDQPRPRKTRTAAPNPSSSLGTFEQVKHMLSTYAPQLKYQRFTDARPVPQPSYETSRFNQFSSQQENEQDELIHQYFIQIKESLALAYESESHATIHHYNAAEKLVMLHERIGNARFKDVLKQDLKMSQR